MSFATDVWTPSSYELAAAIAEAVKSRALPLGWGGTGALPVGANDTERAQDVLKTWGMLDSGLLVPLARLPRDLIVERVLAADGVTTVLRVVTPNTPAASDSLLILRSGIGGSEMFRLVANSDPVAGGDPRVNINMEPQGGGRTTEFGDPFPTTCRPTRALIAETNGGVLSRYGIGAPTVSESTDPATSNPASPTTLRDSTGYYTQYTSDDVDNATCGVGGFELGAVELTPTFYFCGRTAGLLSAFFLFAGNADPAAYVSAPFATNSNFGVGLFYDTDMGHTGFDLRAILCSGPVIALSITNDISVTSGGLLHRTTGSWVTDGIKVGNLYTLAGLGVVINLSLTNKVSVDAQGLMHRNDGGSWITDGIQVGREYTMAGMTGGNNGKRVVFDVTASDIEWTVPMTPEGLIAGAVTVVGDNNGARRCTAVTALNITFETLLCTQSTVTGAVTVDNPGQEVFTTGLVLTANARFAVRIRYLGSGVWDFSTYDFTGKVWNTPVKSATSPCTPGPSDLLKGWWRLRTNGATSRTTAPSLIGVRFNT